MGIHKKEKKGETPVEEQDTTPPADEPEAETQDGEEQDVEPLNVNHLEGCPSDPARIETYEAQKPDKRFVVVTRCLDCGQHITGKPTADPAGAEE